MLATVFVPMWKQMLREYDANKQRWETGPWKLLIFCVQLSPVPDASGLCYD